MISFTITERYLKPKTWIFTKLFWAAFRKEYYFINIISSRRIINITYISNWNVEMDSLMFNLDCFADVTIFNI